MRDRAQKGGINSKSSQPLNSRVLSLLLQTQILIFFKTAHAVFIDHLCCISSFRNLPLGYSHLYSKTYLTSLCKVPSMCNQCFEQISTQNVTEDG
jgi:hypothetical protein